MERISSTGERIAERKRLDLLVSLSPGVVSKTSHTEYPDLDLTLLD